MLRCALLGVLLGVASAARQQAQIDCTSSDAALSKRLGRAPASADATARLQSVQNSLGSANSKATLECNPDIPPQGPPVDVPDIQPAPWHNISHPPDAICAVAVKPYLLYENSYEATPGHVPKDPTVSQVPTEIGGAVSMTIMNAGKTAIKAPYEVTVSAPSYVSLLDLSNAEPVGNVTKGGSMNFRVTQAYQNLEPDFGNQVNVTLVLAVNSQAIAPTYISINGHPCSIGINITLSNVVPGDDTADGSPLSAERRKGNATVEGVEQAAPSTVPLSVSNGQLFGTDGRPVTFKGINWFGFETANTLVDGLWQGPTALTQDFGTVAYRIQLLGFNAIRLPFSFQVLLNTSPISFTASCTPVTATQIAQSVIPPGTNLPPTAIPPAQLAPSNSSSGTCNADMPNTSVYTRFLYVVKVLVDNGFYVLIDNHLNTDSTAVDNPTGWVTYWANLMASIVAMGPQYQNSVMADILNEPDARGLSWTFMYNNYLNAMDAIYKVSPTTLFFVEGCGQLGFSLCWGDGFVTDDAVIAQYGLTDPKPFLTAALGRPYANQIVISPHLYPPSISGQTMNYTGVGLFYKMQTSHGHLTSGYGSTNHTFPLVFGETGSFYTSATDIAMLADMAKYMHNDYSSLPAGYGPASFPHANLPHLFWWDWNPNSGDTGGIVENDWLTIIWSKISWLTGAINLTPWYLTYNGTNPTAPATTPAPAAVTPTPVSVAPATPPATPAPSTKPPATPAPTATPAVTPAPSTKPPATPAPLATPPVTPAPPATTPAAPATSPGHHIIRNIFPAPRFPAPDETPSASAAAPSAPAATMSPSASATPQPPQTSGNSTRIIVGMGTGPATPGPPVTTMGPPTTTGPPPTSTAPPSNISCTIEYTLKGSWPTQSTAPYADTLNMKFINTGHLAVDVPYTLAIHSPSYVLVQNSWNWGVSGSANDGTFSGAVSLGWQNAAPGATVQALGANIWSSSNDFAPKSATVNGVPCQLKSA
ncbi:g5175 [Coccomyxa viridis]|uniref:G5175 protein n=1 Tax=Coccomyxa viridis TaxID=1274662 RepID=A0ABP1FX48_9CHLO